VSSLIVLGIVGIWILVLVPMWLNRHDADSASRSMDTFSTAMRVLSRRDSSQGRFRRRIGRGDRSARAERAADGQYLVVPRDNWGVTVDNQTDTSTSRRLRVPLHLPSRRQSYATSGRAQLIARRRRIAVGFAVLVVGLALSSEFAHTSWWFELGAGLALAGYVIHLRTEAIKSSELRRRRLARAARAAAPNSARTPGAELYYAARVRHDVGIEPMAEPVSAAGGGVSVTGSPSGTEDGSRWEPIAVPLPTYVSKPVVSRPATAAPRADVESGPTIDLTVPGKWIDSQVDVRHLLLDDDAPEVDELDVILARRRAVNH
jgi:type II secretory pathway pseudopilin PulG